MTYSDVTMYISSIFTLYSREAKKAQFLEKSTSNYTIQQYLIIRFINLLLLSQTGI